MHPNPEFIPRLRAQGLRVTSQKMAILGALSRSGAHLTPVQIHALARRELPGLTEPTVYRALEQLVRSGLVWRLSLENGHLAYELAGRNHHHLVCVACGRQVELPAASLNQIYARLETVSGFVLNRDHLTLSGLCPKCQPHHAKKAP